MNRPKILFCTTHAAFPYWGGSEKFWYEILLDARWRDRFESHVLLRKSWITKEYGDCLESLGVRISYFPQYLRGLSRLSRRLKTLTNTPSPSYEQAVWMKAIKSIKPSLVWFNLGLRDAARLEVVCAFCRALNIPYWIVVQAAEENIFFPERRSHELFVEVLKNAQRVFCVAKNNRKILERAVGQRLDNIHMTKNALTSEFLTRAGNISKAHPIQLKNSACFLHLASFEPARKGQHILLEALLDSRWEGRDWKVFFQNGYAPFDIMKRLIRYYGFPDERFELRSHNHDVLPVIGESDLLVMPSLSEGTPFALIEGMACGRPAVGTPIGGIPELIIENETGWLSRSTEVGDFAEALERAWQARDTWVQIGQRAALKIVRDYSQGEVVADLIKAFQENVRTSSYSAL